MAAKKAKKSPSKKAAAPKKPAPKKSTPKQAPKSSKEPKPQTTHVVVSMKVVDKKEDLVGSVIEATVESLKDPSTLPELVPPKWVTEPAGSLVLAHDVVEMQEDLAPPSLIEMHDASEREELVLEAQHRYSTGAHPWLNDIERAEALKDTAARASGPDADPDIIRLRGLLADADRRLAEKEQIVAGVSAALNTVVIETEDGPSTEVVAEYSDDDIVKRVDDLQRFFESHDLAMNEISSLLEEFGPNEARDVYGSVRALVEQARDLQRQLEELNTVEPLATGFAYLYGASFDINKLTPDGEKACEAACNVLEAAAQGEKAAE